MKATQKGNQFEREVKDILEAQGYAVFRQHRRPLFMKGKMITVGSDIFGCDMIAKKKGERSRWIQVSTVENKSKKEQQVLAFPWNLAFEDVELWLRVDGKRQYRRFVLSPNSQTETFVEVGTESYREAA